jgi:hypothetical protein
MTRGDYRRMMIADALKSGIPKKHLEKLGWHALMPSETAAFMCKDPRATFNLPTYEIPYFSTHGKKTGYSRLKNLKPNRALKFGSKKSHTKKKTLKYLQRANTPPHLYLAPIYPWEKHRNQETGKLEFDKLVITEGEKKAVCACLRGIPTVALSGVDSFRSNKRGIVLLEEFDQFDLTVTDIEICFDSDLNTNPDVQRAMSKLAAELIRLNPANISTVIIDGESTDDGKLGLDDFLIQYEDAEAAEAFAQLPREEDKRLTKMNFLSSELCYLASAGKLYNIPDDRYYNSNEALITDYGPKLRVQDPDNPQRQIPAVKLWLDTRTEDTWCENTVYEPGKALRFRPAGQKRDSINTWRPSSITPIEGDITLWLDLVRYVMGTEAHFNWFMQWLAYPLQHPGSKLFQSVFVYSYAQGVGKNFIIEPLIRELYGSAYQVVTSQILEDQYNGWARCKQFIFGEEIYVSDRRGRESTMGHLKGMITNDEISINEKYRPREKFRNCAQYYLTANQSHALALEQADRRFFVVHAPEKPLAQDFYHDLHVWSHKKDSAAKVLSHLLYKVDCSQFDPQAHAPYTEAKEEIVESLQDMTQHWVGEVAHDPETFFSLDGIQNKQQLFTASEIHRAINTHLSNRGDPQLYSSPCSIGRYLNSCGKFPYLRMLINGRRVALYAVFGRKSWKSKKNFKVDKWKAHYVEFKPELKAKILRKLKLKTDKSPVVDIMTGKPVRA